MNRHLNTKCKLNVQKTFKRRPGSPLNVLCKFTLHPVTFPLYNAVRLGFHNEVLAHKCPFYRSIILIFYFVCGRININNSVNNKHFFSQYFLVSLHERCLHDAESNKVPTLKLLFFLSLLRESFFLQVYPDLSFFIFVNIFSSHFDASVVRCIVF